MSRAVAWGLGAGALALAGLWWVWSGTPSASPTAAPRLPPASARLPAAAAPGASGLPSATTVSNAPTVPAAALPAEAPSSMARRPTLQDIDAQIRQLKANGHNPTPAELDQVFAQLQQYNGGNDMGGVNLATVRQALQAAARIQALNEEMKPLAANPTPANVERMQALLKEMQAVQSTVDVSSLMAAGKALSTGAQP